MPMTIAIGNQKGGVAKTTTTVSLGAALVERGLEVLAVDLDPQANLSLALGVKRGSVRRGVADVLLGNLTAGSVSRETTLPGLDVLPANADMHLVEKFLTVRQNYEYALRDALANIARYDVVLCDCPPSVGAIPFTAVTAAGLLLVPTQCEYFATHGLGEVLELVTRARERTNPYLRYRILVTMYDPRNRIHRTVLDQLRGAFPGAVLETVIEMDSALRESQVFGQPITAYAPQSRAATQYRALAQELSVYAQTEKSPQPA
jgi:chromosome partitioning protein